MPGLEHQDRPQLVVPLSRLPRQWSSSRLFTAPALKYPRWSRRPSSSRSPAISRRSCRNQTSRGTPNPCLGRSMISAGNSSRTARFRMYLVDGAVQLQPDRQARGELHELVVEHRRPPLEAVRHRRDVHLHQQAVGEVVADIHVQLARRADRRRRSCRRSLARRARPAPSCEEIRFADLPLEFRAEDHHAARVSLAATCAGTFAATGGHGS